MVILEASSGVACTSTGISSLASRNVSAIARSSPKLGSDTITPSSRSRLFRNNAAHSLASWCVSTAPCLLSSGPSTTQSMPAFARAWIISSRPTLANWSGKNPRFPIMTPIVIFFAAIGMPLFYDSEKSRTTRHPRTFLRGRKTQAKKYATNQKHRAPPNISVQIVEHNPTLRRIQHLVDPPAEDHRSVHRQRHADEEPNRQRSTGFHRFPLPENDLQNHKHNRHDYPPEQGAVPDRNIFLVRNRRQTVDQASQLRVRLGLG